MELSLQTHKHTQSAVDTYIPTTPPSPYSCSSDLSYTQIVQIERYQKLSWTNWLRLRLQDCSDFNWPLLFFLQHNEGFLYNQANGDTRTQPHTHCLTAVWARLRCSGTTEPQMALHGHISCQQSTHPSFTPDSLAIASLYASPRMFNSTRCSI